MQMGNLGSIRGKKKKVKKKIQIVVVILMFLCIAATVAGVTGLISAIVGFLKNLFSPIIDSEMYQTQGIYASIRDLGGAYNAYTNNILGSLSINKDVLESVFQEESLSFEANTTYQITIPKVNAEAYYEWEKSDFPEEATTDLNKYLKKRQKDTDILLGKTECNWDMSAFTYRYRKNWEYMLSVAVAKQFNNMDEFVDKMEEVLDNMDDEGNLKDSDIEWPVTADEMDEVERYIEDTSIEYFTNYYRDEDGVTDIPGDYPEGVINDYKYTSYCFKLFYPDGKDGLPERYDNFDDTYNEDGNVNTADLMRVSNNGVFGDTYDIGNDDGTYAYITYHNKLYPVMLIKKASNWLCDYKDFNYEKVKDPATGNTRYVLSSYVKTYKIQSLIDSWDELGMGSETYDIIFQMLDVLQEKTGITTVGQELEEAYNYYCETGEEKVVYYVDGTYCNAEWYSEHEKTVLEEEETGHALTNIKTDHKQLVADLVDAGVSSSMDFTPSIQRAVDIADAFYNNSLCYMPNQGNEDDDADSTHGYVTSFGSTTYGEHQWGAKWQMDGSNAEKTGLCSAGFIEYILRNSLLGNNTTYSPKYQVAPSKTDIYKYADFRFKNTDDLRVGDIAIMSTSDSQDDATNVIGIYMGNYTDDDGNVNENIHLFYALVPEGTYGSDGSVQMFCMEGDDPLPGIQRIPFKYFCRYYTGRDSDKNERAYDEWAADDPEGVNNRHEEAYFTQYDKVTDTLKDSDYYYMGADIGEASSYVSENIKSKAKHSFNDDIILYTVSGIIGEGSDSSGTNDPGEETSSIELEGSDDAEQMWNYFKSLGHTDICVAAIMGNIAGEGLTIYKADVRYYTYKGRPMHDVGIVQWTNPRCDAFLAWCDENGYDYHELGPQLEYVNLEFETGYMAMITLMDTYTDYEDIDTATNLFCTQYERPDELVAHRDRRVAAAQGYYDLYAK